MWNCLAAFPPVAFLWKGQERPDHGHAEHILSGFTFDSCIWRYNLKGSSICPTFACAEIMALHANTFGRGIWLKTCCASDKLPQISNIRIRWLPRKALDSNPRFLIKQCTSLPTVRSFLLMQLCKRQYKVLLETWDPSCSKVSTCCKASTSCPCRHNFLKALTEPKEPWWPIAVQNLKDSIADCLQTDRTQRAIMAIALQNLKEWVPDRLQIEDFRIMQAP